MVSDRNNTNIENDFFKDVFSYENLSATKICIFALGVLIGFIGAIGIIWYERHGINRFRTVINQMVATGAWCLLFDLIICICDSFRFLNGPYGLMFCDIETFLKNALWSFQLITLDVILILRYIFIFYVKNFTDIKDDVLALILKLSILIVAIWASVVKRFTPGRLPLNYYLCAGINPDENQKEKSYLEDQKKYNTGRTILLLSFLMHLIMIPRIFYYQVKTHKKERPIQLGTNNSDCLDKIHANQSFRGRKTQMIRISSNNKPILDLVTHIAVFTALLSFGIVIIIADNIEPKQLNLEKYNWIPLTIQMFGPLIGAVAIVILLLNMHDTVRRVIFGKMFGLFRR